jgi:hypothetical protein
MYKLYTITKEKSKIRGFWRDENGKIFRDKIAIKYFNYNDFKIAREKLFASGEKAVFYVLEYTYKSDFAYIESASGEAQALRHCITWQEKKLRPSFVKALLCQHNGLTIFKTEKGFTLELWKA